MDPNAPEGSKIKIRCDQDDMVFIRNNLVLAEMSRRQGNTVGVYAAYNKLAESYKKKMDWKTSIFFQEKCLEVAQLTSDLRAEMTANHTLGEIYFQMDDFARSREYHERHEEIAVSMDSDDDLALANIELHKVYLVLANRLEAAGENNEALQMFEKCVEAAKKCRELSAEAEANGKIGNLLLRLGEPAQALPYLRQYSQISTDLGDTEARCRASSALAWALDSLGDNDKALTELNLVHSISEQAGDAYLQSQACRALGTLYSKVGQLTEAVNALQRHFELLKAISQKVRDPTDDMDASPQISLKDVELARVYVGISKGNLLQKAYLHIVSFDMSALLDWKLSRAEIAGKEKY